MSYTSLYRKFRPDTFSGVKGQEHVITTLKNQIKAKRIGHAYLFCGTRGTGKTTVAKILAKAVNCESPLDGDPCLECPTCRSIAAGTNMDVSELDAASNNGVEDVRSIIDEVNYTPGMSKYKVYIVDEVHMLTGAACNAFLKTLEEPPAHVIFILATTDPQRLPDTILSRCQRYDFRRMSVPTIADHMEELLSVEGVSATREAVEYVAKAADGSMRDGLSLLDQCVAFHGDRQMTYDSVLEILGAVDRDVFEELLDYLVAGQVTGCVQKVDEICSRGRELSRFVLDFTGYVRDRLLEQVQRGGKEPGDIPIEILMNYIKTLSELAEKMRYATLKRVLLDTALISLCVKDLGNQASNAGAVDSRFLSRLSEMERKIQELTARVESASSNNRHMGAAGPANTPAQPQQKPKPLPKAIPEDLLPLKGKWGEIVSQMGSPASQYMSGGSLSVDDYGGLLLVFRDSICMELFKRNAEYEERFREIVTGMVKKTFDLTMKAVPRGENPTDGYPNIFDGINMEVDIED